MRAEALALLRDGMNAHLDPDLVTADGRPDSRVARRKAAYYAAIATNSDFRGRLEAVDRGADRGIHAPTSGDRQELGAGVSATG